jgi:hypothetical protein
LLNSVLPAGQQISTGAGVATGIYKRFGDFDKVNAKIEVVTTGLWSGDVGSLEQFFTASSQTTSTSGYYYTNVYNSDPVAFSDSAEVQFAVAYGHVNGSGSMRLGGIGGNDSALVATKATYAQYRSMLLDPTDNKFSFENSAAQSIDANGIYIINIARNRFREKMDAGNWTLTLSGSNGIFTFIDNSGKKFGDDLGLSGRVFKVVSGSLELGTENEAIENTSTDATTGEGYGLFYPDRGIIVLNAKAIGSTLGNITTETIYTKDNISGGTGITQISGNISGSHLQTAEQFNQYRLLQAIRKGGDFEARRTENISTQHFFVRATNREFNYSNNPTYIDADGFFVESTFETDPQTYITTIGLYNDSNELIAVAKTSQPLVKSFDKEVLIKVKLSF